MVYTIITASTAFGRASNAAFGQSNRVLHRIEYKPALHVAYTDASIRPRYGGVGLVREYMPHDNAKPVKTTMFATVLNINDINRLELSAIFLALETTELDVGLVVYSDSQTALDLIANKNRKPKYDRLKKFTLELLAARTAPTSFSKVKAHSGNRGNDHADALAGQGSSSRCGIFVLPDEFGSIEEWRKYHVEDTHIACFTPPKISSSFDSACL